MVYIFIGLLVIIILLLFMLYRKKWL